MKAKKLISAILSVGLLASCVATVGATTTETQSYNDYQKMLTQTQAENNYGLAKTVNEGKILQAWNWSYENIIARMETVAKQGFTTIQVSPPNEIKMPTKGSKVCEPDGSNGWWMFYQPAGFQLNESEDNALGTKAEFVKMCEEADKYGLKILVDAVINHMGTDDDHVDEPYNNTSVDPMDHVNPRAQEFEPELISAKAFHSPWIDCTYVENLGQSMRQYDSTGLPILDSNGNYTYGGSATVYDITESNTRHCTSGLPDLDTSQQIVQDAIYDYLDELIAAGADGFRIDAAKHIETSEDIPEFATDFWEDTLLKVREKYSDREIYAYGEILNTCGAGRSFSMYTKMMDVTDSGSFWGMKDAVCGNGTGGNSIPLYPNANFTKENVIQWNESHDTYIDGGTSFFTVEQRDKIWALTAARQTITGVYFARPDDRAGNDRAAIEAICSNIEIGEANVTSWANPAVKAVNQFSNYFGDAEESLSVQSRVTVIERGITGAVLVNLNGTEKEVNLYVDKISNGTYTDAVTGNTFTIENGYLKGKIGNTGIAALYYSEDKEPVPQPVIDYTEGYPVKEGYNTIVFTNNRKWNEVNCYCWNDANKDNPPVAWPGSPMRFALKNEYNESQYYAFVPKDCTGVVINNGAYEQSKDIAVTGHQAYYLKAGFSSPFTAVPFDVKFNDPNAQQPTTAPITEPKPAPKLTLKKTKLNAAQTTKAVVSNKDGKKVTFSSTNPKIAKIDSKGNITALNKGSIYIKAKIGGKTLKAKLTVKTAPEIKDGKKTLKTGKVITVRKGRSKTLKITGKVSNIKNSVNLKSNKIAKITSKTTQSKIVIKGKKKGSTTLTVVINKVKTYKIKVRVK